MLLIFRLIKEMRENKQPVYRLKFVLFGFMGKLTSHLERSPLIHSYGYESTGDRSTGFASLPLKSKSFVQYPG